MAILIPRNIQSNIDWKSGIRALVHGPLTADPRFLALSIARAVRNRCALRGLASRRSLVESKVSVATVSTSSLSFPPCAAHEEDFLFFSDFLLSQSLHMKRFAGTGCRIFCYNIAFVLKPSAGCVCRQIVFGNVSDPDCNGNLT